MLRRLETQEQRFKDRNDPTDQRGRRETRSVSKQKRSRSRGVQEDDTALTVVNRTAFIAERIAIPTGINKNRRKHLAGTNIVYVKSGNYTRGGDGVGILSGLGAADTLIEGDSDAIQGLSGIANVSPGNSVRTFISSNGARIFSRIQGISPSFGNIYSWNYVQGGAIESPISESAVLGTNLAVDLFQAAF